MALVKQTYMTYCFSDDYPSRQANAARALALDRQRAEEKRKEQKDCLL